MTKKKALILLSGGQDSTSAAIWAKENGYDLTAIIFYYGQRHKVEIVSAIKVADILKIPFFIKKVEGVFLTNSALTNSALRIRTNKKTNLPTSFVPGRNILFLAIAAAEAYDRGIHDLITGVSQEDYSGYPDCREGTIKSLEKTLTHGMNYIFNIHTPWMHKTKVEEIMFLKNINYLSILKHTHTCYNGIVGGCGKCPACKIRAKAFKAAGFKDPLKERR